MQMIIVFTVMACALAEPPVGDNYAPARGSHDKGVEIQRSLSLEYGAPDIGPKEISSSFRSGLSSGYPASARSSKPYVEPNLRSGISQEYGTPNSRSLSQEYGTPNSRSLSQEYGTPNSRSLSQEYGTPNSRSLSQEYSTPNSRSLSQEYGTPNTRNPSQEYGVPSSRNSVSHNYESSSRSQGYNSRGLNQNYGAPQIKSDLASTYNSARNTPSDSYGTPLQRSPSNLYNAPDFNSKPSGIYGVPSQRNSDSSYQPNSRSSFGSAPNSISQEYGVPSTRIGKSQGYPERNYESSSRTSPSQTYGTSRSLSTLYEAPNAKSSNSYSRGSRLSSSYLPSQGVSDSYSAPISRGLTTEYKAPDSRTNLNNNAYSSYDTERSSPSQAYGVPKSAMPSEQYGAPDSYNALSNQEQGYARNSLDEILSQEPASYDFEYKVNDYLTGSDFGHTETRQDNRAEGSYFVVLPDGTKQIVEYEADERGFKPRISLEPASARSGYDENASDLSKSGDGPY